MNITRRAFALAAIASTLLGGGILAGLSIGGFERTATAQSVSQDDLNKPGPLGDIALGSDNAPITMIEYASMTCPHCAHFSNDVFPEFKKKYIDTGKVRYIMREFPLDQLAAAAFMLARCAGKDRYYPMIETLFATQRDWVVQKPLQPLLRIAKQAGMSEDAFNECLKDQKILDGINEVRERASKVFKVDSTPTFFINGKIFKGEATLEEFEKQLAPFLKS